MLLALNAFKVVSSGPPPAASRTSIGLLLALTRPLVTGPPVEPPASNYAGGGGVRRIRKFGPRKRKREELEELLEAIAVTPPEIPALPPVPATPPAPGLMADVPMPPRTVVRSPPDEDEDEIALLLELIS
jgi:hypothetical protein